MNGRKLADAPRIVSRSSNDKIGAGRTVARGHSVEGLDPKDRLELLRCVKRLGLTRVARIAAALTDTLGERGSPEKPDIPLLLQIAHMKLQQQPRSLHSIAAEVAGNAHAHRSSKSLASLTTELERDFRRERHKWHYLASHSRSPSLEDLANDALRQKSVAEIRARARLVELLPDCIDLYDALVADAKKSGPNNVTLVKAARREQIDPLLAKVITEQGESPVVKGHHGRKRIPRGLFDLVEEDLSRLAEAKAEAAKQRRSIGRKRAKQI
jgi:hypothetical protein